MLPELLLKAVPYSMLNRNTPVWNSNQLCGFIYVSIPEDLALAGYRLIDVVEVSTSPASSCCSTFEDYVVRHNTHLWVDIASEWINTDVGKHVYCLTFSARCVPNKRLYISYIIQDDCPDKPYVYMDRENR